MFVACPLRMGHTTEGEHIPYSSSKGCLRVGLSANYAAVIANMLYFLWPQIHILNTRYTANLKTNRQAELLTSSRDLDSPESAKTYWCVLPSTLAWIVITQHLLLICVFAVDCTRSACSFIYDLGGNACQGFQRLTTVDFLLMGRGERMNLQLLHVKLEI